MQRTGGIYLGLLSIGILIRVIIIKHVLILFNLDSTVKGFTGNLSSYQFGKRTAMFVWSCAYNYFRIIRITLGLHDVEKLDKY